MLKALWDCIRYLYNDPSVSFIQLMVTAWQAETEVMINKAGVSPCKAGVVNKTITIMVRRFKHFPNKLPPLCPWLRVFRVNGGKPKSQGHCNQNKVASNQHSENGEVNEQGSRNANHSNILTYPKPSSTAVGSFRRRQKPVQCYQCCRWGHVYKDCTTPVNFWWRQVNGDLPPI